MRRVAVGSLMMMVALAGCDDEYIFGFDEPAAPRDVAASYYAGVVTVTWELAPDWNGESFRVYSRRITDADYFLIAEVTSCAGGLCAYEDANVLEGQTYEYYVSALDPDTGFETASDYSVEVFVPSAVGPPAPNSFRVIALDDANYLAWGDGSRVADDFSHYKVYLDEGNGVEFLLGETDSEGFLDLLARNGETSSYFATAVDTDGHESSASSTSQGTPRPDFHGEWLYDHFGQPSVSGFRFSEDESTNPILSGTSFDRHFRLEVDDQGWWLILGPQSAIYPVGFQTTSLKCDVAADAGCVDVTAAPTSGYVTQDVALQTQTSYVLRVVGNDGQDHFGVIRPDLLGYDQDDDALMIFDWAYQVQAGNPDLVESVGR
ncbi:MAG: hypothetical protein VX815_11820 [Gemmatimonadota bacterium]|nr:hypothetical protein [Gemmatimonadota bacterium]